MVWQHPFLAACRPLIVISKGSSGCNRGEDHAAYLNRWPGFLHISPPKSSMSRILSSALTGIGTH